MFNNVLVGVDQRHRGRDAVALAARLVAAGGRLRFAHVQSPSPARGDHREVEATGRHAALTFLNSVIAEAGVHGVKADAHFVAARRVDIGLREVAERTDADLLVIGSSHGAPRGRVWLGKEMRQMLGGAPCAVAVAPVAYAELGTPITQIGVAYNGSEESLNAVQVGLELARDRRASAFAFQALPASVPGEPDGGRGHRDSPYRALEEAARELIRRETGMTGCVAIGNAASELSIFSAGVDLLVVGSRDYGPVGRLVHGSTTRDLLGHARSPLLILTRASRAREAAQAAVRTVPVTAP